MLRTCLLLSDDPDDQVEITEALSEVSEDIVVLTSTDSEKALQLLIHQTFIPDLLIVDLSVGGISPDEFVALLAGAGHLQKMRLVLYGDSLGYPDLDRSRCSLFFDHDISYSALRKLLHGVAGGPDGRQKQAGESTFPD